MTVTKTVSGYVERVERQGHTYYGNPIITIGLSITAIDRVEAISSEIVRLRISDNASLVYEIANSEFRDTPHTFALTRAGRVSHVIRAGA